MNTPDEWRVAEVDLREQLALEARLDGWQVYRAHRERWARYQKIPAGHYWAAHWHLREPLIIAGTLEELEKGVLARQKDMTRERAWAERSALDRIPPRQ